MAIKLAPQSADLTTPCTHRRGGVQSDFPFKPEAVAPPSTKTNKTKLVLQPT